ncbi:MAG: CoA pyrophosphatase [Actinomycetota bacterium]
MYPERFREFLRESLEPSPSAAPPPGDRLAAVLVPLIEVPEPTLVFTRRGEDLSRHPGEISFPGGLQHDEDAGLASTALRESHEELGILTDNVDVLGALEPVHTVVSGILVVPFVGALEVRPEFLPRAGEISEVLEFPVERLLDAEGKVEIERGGARFTTYAYEMDGSTIWGATGRMLHNFLEIVRKVRM